jgi:ATP-dependent helicase HrpA
MRRCGRLLSHIGLREGGSRDTQAHTQLEFVLARFGADEAGRVVVDLVEPAGCSAGRGPSIPPSNASLNLVQRSYSEHWEAKRGEVWPSSG